MSVQDETKARWIPGCWRGSPQRRAALICSGSSKAHIRSDLQRASNEAGSLEDKRINLILNAHWNRTGIASERRHLERLFKIFDRVFHFHASNLPKALGHPLSNQKIYENFKALHAMKR
jgi:hypothetical protein